VIGRALFPPLAICAVAICGAAFSKPEDILAGKPPTLASLKSQIDAAPPCVSESYVANTSSGRAKPAVIKRCPAVFPKILQKAGFVGNCRSMFDADPSGALLLVETRCAVDNVFTYDATPPAWMQLAQDTFVYAATKAVRQYQVTALADAPPGQIRENLAMVMGFDFGAGNARPPAPPEFQRPPPAPTLSPRPANLPG
jgi:hypothetical protein